jgi:phosphoadenosine phosphosulfate reductase
MRQEWLRLNLKDKAEKSKEVIMEALKRFGENKVAAAWTGGKDSTVLLYMIREACQGQVPIPIVFVDTGKHFPEVYKFRDDFVKKWDLNLINAKNTSVINVARKGIVKLENLSEEMKSELRQIGWKKDEFRIALDRDPCCHLLKTVATKEAITNHGLEALIVGIRWDEQEARSRETFFSPRKDPPHVRVHPILHFSWKDVWEYTKMMKLPHNPLYDRGFTSLGCYTCTSPNPDGKIERAGRAQDKEETMNRLRALGYF